jgi:hypothetical protein
MARLSHAMTTEVLRVPADGVPTEGICILVDSKDTARRQGNKAAMQAHATVAVERVDQQTRAWTGLHR